MNFWNKMPLVRAALPFILGLFSSIELNLKLGLVGAVISVLGITYLTIAYKRLKSIKQNQTFVFIAMLTLFILGALRGEIHKTNTHNKQLTQEEIIVSDAFVLKLEGEFTEKAKSYKVKATIVGKYLNGKLEVHEEPTLVYVPKSLASDSLFNAGQILALAKPNQISPPKNPNEFNYKKYLNGLGIAHQFYLDSAHLRLSEPVKTIKFLDTFENFREQNLKRLKELGISDKSFSVISALVFGKKDFLSAELYDAYGSAGATHVLAVSGLHVGLIYVILVWFCKAFKRKKLGRLISIFLIIIGLWSYAAITGFSPSVLRASTMFSFICIAQFANKGSNIFNTIAASALVLLVAVPNLIMEVGFQLSYSAVLGILIIQPFLYKLFSPNSWLLDKVWQITTVSIAAQLGTFPLGMLYFHQFPNYFMLSNLFVIPLATVILYLTLITLAASFIPGVGYVLGLVLDYVVKFLNLAIDKMTHLPFARSEGIDISVFECFLLYAIILQLVFIFIRKSYASLKWFTALTVFFFALQCQEIYTQHSQKHLTIHVIKGERAFSIVEGKTCYFICSQKLREDASKFKFHVSHYLDHLGIDQIITIALEEEYHCNAFYKTNRNLIYRNYIISDNDHLNAQLGRDLKPIILVNKVDRNMSYSSESIYYADGYTKKKYLIKKEEINAVNELEYALVLK